MNLNLKRNVFVVVLACLMAWSLFAQPVVEQAPPAATTVEFTDDLGRTVTLPSKVERILPSGLISQYVLFPLAADRFVGSPSGGTIRRRELSTRSIWISRSPARSTEGKRRPTWRKC